jgi:hypothetical protein
MEASEDRVVVRRMDVWSTARLSLVVYALVGLVFGVFWAVLMGSMGSMGWPGPARWAQQTRPSPCSP